MTSKPYKKLNLFRDAVGFADPKLGHYKIERTRIELPVELAEAYNDVWQDSGVYYLEIEEKEKPTSNDNYEYYLRKNKDELIELAKYEGNPRSISKEELINKIIENEG